MKTYLGILLFLVIVGGAGVLLLKKDSGETLPSTIDESSPVVTSKNIPQEPTRPSCTDVPGGEGVPVITSISPSSSAVGTVVEIRGCNLSGFEGDRNATFQRADGKTIVLNDIDEHTVMRSNLIRVRVKEPCQPGETTYDGYSGRPSLCDFIAFTPGVYTVYTIPWGKKSNIVSFTLTK